MTMSNFEMLLGFDDMSDEDKCAVLSAAIMTNIPNDHVMVMTTIKVLLSSLLPAASSNCTCKDVSPTLPLRDKIIANGAVLVREAMESASESGYIDELEALFKTQKH
jgi:hypothetical protein